MEISLDTVLACKYELHIHIRYPQKNIVQAWNSDKMALRPDSC